ncbi:hypothetical protein GOODEAATRI_004932 [Goodea atripinnis]|uniref:Secreted protein n=1 Tax=Goodea atripinnis TaxID=208336 RepID=A0ABV0MRB7_9TELE
MFTGPVFAVSPVASVHNACLWCGAIQMAPTDGCCGLRRDYLPLFPSLPCFLRLLEPCDTLANYSANSPSLDGLSLADSSIRYLCHRYGRLRSTHAVCSLAEQRSQEQTRTLHQPDHMSRSYES